MNTSTPKLTIQTFLNPFEIYSDARTHGYDGPSRRARIGRVTPQGGGTIASSADGTRVAVTGKECLRILRVHDQPSTATTPARIDVSRNFWEGSGLKIDSASTDIAWGHGVFNNKLLTSGRNGELIMWDINKSGTTKYERRTKDHIRSIHKMAVSPRVDSYCITGSADGDMRVWDLRDISKSIMRIHHPTSVRSLVFSPSAWQPLEAVVGLDNGSIYRWDLRYGQRGQLDKLPVAHTASVTALDWCYPGAQNSNESNKGMGWLVSGGLDRTVKVWDLTSPVAKAHIPHKPTYTLHPSYGVRRIAWRPGYECELAIVTNLDYPISVLDQAIPESKPGILTRVSSGLGLDALVKGAASEKGPASAGTSPQSSFSEPTVSSSLGDAIEIWDVRREWLAKWSVTGSASDGGVTDLHFRGGHALWTQNSSGAFSQLDLREATKPIDAVPRVATTWDATGSLSLVVDDSALNRWEVPYDDVAVSKREPIETRKQQQQQSKYKALGDPVVRMATQTVATFRPPADAEDETIDVMTFTNLARRYIFEGRSKAEICAFNAGVALSSGHEIAAQFWLLLGACVSQLVPKPPPPHQHAEKHPPASHASSGPQKSAQSQSSTTLGAYSFPGPSSPNSAVMSLEEKSTHFPSHYASTPISRKNTLDGTSSSIPSPSRLPTVGNLNSKSSDTLAHGSTLGHFTPSSSARSSPRHIPVNLPALGPRRLSVVNRRHSVNIGALVSGSPRRPSLPGSHVHSSHAIPMTSSPGERTTFPLSSSVASSSHLNSRKENIDEGALDESDSDHNSDEGDGDEESFEGEAGSPDGSSSGEEAQIDPGPMRRRENSFLNARPFTSPSPLRLENRNSWGEDELEDEDDTEVPVRAPSRPKDDDPGYDPSPQQSDEDSETSDDDATGSNLTLAGLAGTPTSHIIKPTKKKSRSRSSTVATLSAPPPQALARQQSDSSARTVIASVGGTLPAIPDIHRYDGQVSTDQERSRSQQNRERGSSQHHVKATPGHRRTISQPISAHNLGGLNSSNAARSVSNAPSRQPSTKHKEYATPHYSPEAPSVTERRIEYIGADERRLRETTLAALREALEDFSDRGDIQMCAMVALVAPSDLKISPLRVTRFLESYLEILSRLRLDTCAAYIRKYCETEDIRKWTMLETTIYTSCGKCRKPLMLPAGSFKGAAIAKGAFSFCLACKASPMKCSICRLPVRTLLFQCSVCHHGGHQACYTQFYMHSNEMRDLPSKAINDVRGRTWLRATTGSSLSVLTENSGVSGSTASTEDDELSSTVSGTSTEAASTAPGSVPLNTPGNSAYQSPVIRKPQPLFGHPCAAGCGHFCWAASGNPEL